MGGELSGSLTWGRTGGSRLCRETSMEPGGPWNPGTLCARSLPNGPPALPPAPYPRPLPAPTFLFFL